MSPQHYEVHNYETSTSISTTSRLKPQKSNRNRRVTVACLRCRQQKLKCDIDRPCTLCLRSRVDCISRERVSQDPLHGCSPASSRARKHRSNDHAQNNFRDVSDDTNLVQEFRSLPRIPDCAEGYPDHNLTFSHLHNTPPALQDSDAQHRPRVEATATQSAMEFVRHVFDQHQIPPSTETSAMPGGNPTETATCDDSILQGILSAPKHIIQKLVDTYFNEVHWFIPILHSGTFRQKIRTLLNETIPGDSSMSDALLLSVVLALGAGYISHESSFTTRGMPSINDFDFVGYQSKLIRAARSHIIFFMEFYRLEHVSTCLLLSLYYIYHGSPNLAWSLFGLAVKTAHALNLHHRKPPKDFSSVAGITRQIELRVWCQLNIADGFYAMIFGRPPTLGRNSAAIPLPECLDDCVLPHPLRRADILQDDSGQVNLFAFQVHRRSLYEIVRNTVSEFVSLEAQQPLSGQQMVSLRSIVCEMDTKLREWHQSLPKFFRTSAWTRKDYRPFDDIVANNGGEIQLAAKILTAQAIALRTSYDNALLLVHRPLLFQKLISEGMDGLTITGQSEPFKSSFSISSAAAYSMAKLAAVQSKSGIDASFASLHFLYAGVVLSIQPVITPFSLQSHEAKSHIMKLLKTSQEHAQKSQASAQSSKLLTKLMKAIVERELEMATNIGDLTDTPTKKGPSTGNIDVDNTRSQRPSRPLATDSVDPLLPGHLIPPEQQQSYNNMNRGSHSALETPVAPINDPSSFGSHHGTAHLPLWNVGDLEIRGEEEADIYPEYDLMTHVPSQPYDHIYSADASFDTWFFPTL